ncbi:DUF6193 family natural product biosynthesis protein [Streptomyces olivaceoviridis]|uniref:DUF6193 family natural product biosynthesis protein n=1 Tax=Streptomyces olivaceoviridis TaxID=1921 RepID=UPI0036F70CFD
MTYRSIHREGAPPSVRSDPQVLSIAPSPRIAGTDSAQAAVAMVVDRLPPHCGPAFIGNAEELAAYERARDST